MKKQFLLFVALASLAATVSAQSDSTVGTLWKPNTPNYKVKHAFEVESLVPMFFTGGFHFAVCYRFERFRFRASVINGGSYNADNQALGDVNDGYERYYTTSPGFFMGYNVWKNLEIYGYYERHTFKVEQLSTGENQDILSNDAGIGISYQFFIGRTFYIQPGVHSYFRAEQTVTFSNSETYVIPTFELSPVIRIGVRLWRKY